MVEIALEFQYDVFSMINGPPRGNVKEIVFARERILCQKLEIRIFLQNFKNKHFCFSAFGFLMIYVGRGFRLRLGDF